MKIIKHVKALKWNGFTLQHTQNQILSKVSNIRVTDTFVFTHRKCSLNLLCLSINCCSREQQIRSCHLFSNLLNSLVIFRKTKVLTIFFCISRSSLRLFLWVPTMNIGGERVLLSGVLLVFSAVCACIERNQKSMKSKLVNSLWDHSTCLKNKTISAIKFHKEMVKGQNWGWRFYILYCTNFCSNVVTQI